MKTLKEALFNKKNLENYNHYGITKKDMIGDIEGFPVGVVVRMMEEQERQGNEPNVSVFQMNKSSGSTDDGGGFDWRGTEAKFTFWSEVITYKDFNLFFEKYPEYKEYN